MKYKIYYVYCIDKIKQNEKLNDIDYWPYTCRYNDENVYVEEYKKIIKNAFISGLEYITICNDYCEIEKLNRKLISYNDDISVISKFPASDIKESIKIDIVSVITLSRKGMKAVLDYFNGIQISAIDLKTEYMKCSEYFNEYDDHYYIIDMKRSMSSIYINKVISKRKELRIGSFGMFDSKIDTVKSKFVNDYFIDTLNKVGIPAKYCDCFKEECDIVIYSLFNYRYNMKTQSYNKMDFTGLQMLKCKGYPIFIYYTPENENFAWTKIHNNYESNVLDSYSISFFEDNETNLYWPLWVQRYDKYKKLFATQRNAIPLNGKTKFCTFIVSNKSSEFRNEVFEYICKNYKKIDSIGKYNNNQPNHWVLPKEDYVETSHYNIKYHIPYKFNMCFENSASSGNLSYITEKIMDAFIYHTVPIYWGAENIEKYFNKDAFINCNGLTKEEILEKIKEVDENDALYYKMLNANPFYEYKDYVEHYNRKYVLFIIDILMKNKYRLIKE